jgi:hypothetical protein
MEDSREETYMKSRLSNCTTAITLFALAVPVWLVAQDNQDHKHNDHHDTLIDIGKFGGPNTNPITQGVGAQILNNRGIVTGSADTSIPIPTRQTGCFVSQAFKWAEGFTY